jgi:hypothetical protein
MYSKVYIQMLMSSLRVDGFSKNRWTTIGTAHKGQWRKENSQQL